MNSNKYLWDGSYTIEAAFLVPMILGVLYAWMFQLFYLHDQVVLNGMLQDYVIQVQQDRTAGDSTTEAERREKLEALLWIAEVTELEIRRNALWTKGRVCAEAEWKIPVMEQFLGSHFQSRITQNISSVEPRTTLRLVKDVTG